MPFHVSLIVIHPILSQESSGINLVSAVDSGKGNASYYKPLHAVNNEVEPIIASVSIDNSEHKNVDKIRESSTEENKKEVISLSFQKEVEKNSHAVRARAKPLTNKERLLLRQQALKTKRRPVLAVGESKTISPLIQYVLLLLHLSIYHRIVFMHIIIS